jgi:hypothetical protein
MSVTFQDGVTPLNAANLNTLESKPQKGLANGYASLDSGGKVPVGQLPASATGVPVPTVVNGQWLKGVGGAAVWSAIAAADLPAQAVATYGTTLPASPTDGAEHVLVDSTTNPSYQWRFRYNAGSSSAYKWEFIGGSFAQSLITTGEGLTTLSTWSDLATIGPQVTLPRAGDYDVQASSMVSHSAQVAQVWLSLYLNNSGGASGPGGITQFLPNAGWTLAPLPSLTGRFSGVAASDKVKLMYYNQLAGTATFSQRWLRVLPVRVS